MPRERLGVGLMLVASLVLVASLFASALLIVHWLLALAAFVVLLTDGRSRLAAGVSLAVLVGLLVAGLGWSGFSFGRSVGTPGATGDLGALGTLVAVTAGAVAIAVYLVLRGTFLVRTIASGAVASLFLLVGGMREGLADGILGLAFFGTMILSFVSLAIRTRQEFKPAA